MIYPEPLQKLIDFYKKLPGIGEKNAERMALATIDLDLEEIVGCCSQNFYLKKQKANLVVDNKFHLEYIDAKFKKNEDKINYLNEKNIYVFENLSYDDEKISIGTPKELMNNIYELLSVVIIERI